MSNQNAAIQKTEFNDLQQLEPDTKTSHAVANSDVVNDNKPEKKPPTEFFTLIRKYASLSDALRMLGALAVAAAMGVFLLEGVEVANDLYRFLTMLGLTTALTGAGLLMSSLLKEQRGSRVFIGLGLLSVPVNFTVFGALIYSIFPIGSATAQYPAFAHWQVASVSEIPLAIVSGVVVLLPVIWLGYTVLARSARSWLSTALVIGSMCLIVPVRDELWSAALALLSGGAMWWFIANKSNEALALKTLEGRFAKALLYVAPAIIAARSVFLYQASNILLLVIAGGVYLIVRNSLSKHLNKGFFSATLTIATAIAGVCVSIAASAVLSDFLGFQWIAVIGAVILLIIAFDLQLVAPERKLRSVVGTMIAFTAGLALVTQTGGYTNDSWITWASTLILIAVAVLGQRLRFYPTAIVGWIGAASIIALNFSTLWGLAVQTGWWGIAAVGGTAIVAGSMLDRAGTEVKVAV